MNTGEVLPIRRTPAYVPPKPKSPPKLTTNTTPTTQTPDVQETIRNCKNLTEWKESDNITEDDICSICLLPFDEANTDDPAVQLSKCAV